MGGASKSNFTFIVAAVISVIVLLVGGGFLVKALTDKPQQAPATSLGSVGISDSPTTVPSFYTTAPTIPQYSLTYSNAGRIDVVVASAIAATQGKVTALLGVLASEAVVYSTSPVSLPAGITFNAKTGLFSGTPTALTNGDVSYQVTALHSGIHTVATVVINVHQAVQYAATNAVYMAGSPITANAIVNPIPSVVSYSAAGLPSGLTLNVKTGALSGAPLSQLSATVFEVQGFDVNNVLRSSAFITIKIQPVTTMIWRGLDCGMPIGTAPVTYFLNDAQYLANAAATSIGLSKQVIESNNNRMPPPVMQSVRLGQTIVYQLPAETAGFWSVRLHFVASSDIPSQSFVTGTIEGLDFSFDIAVQGNNQINTDVVKSTDVLVADGVLNIVLKSASTLPVSISAIEWAPKDIAVVTPATNGAVAYGGIQNVLAQAINLSATIANPSGISAPQVNQVSAFCVQGCTTPSNWAVDGWFASAAATNKALATANYAVPVQGAAAPLTFNLKYTPGPTSAVYPAKEIVTFRFSGINMAPVTVDVTFQGYPVTATTAAGPAGTTVAPIGGVTTVPPAVTTAATPTQAPLPPGTAVPQLVTMGPPGNVVFNQVLMTTNIQSPSHLEVGPDYRLYVGTFQAGTLSSFVYSFAIDENYNLSDQQIVAQGINGVFGMAFNPFNGDKVIVYVSTGIPFSGGGGCYTGPVNAMTYNGVIYTFTKQPNGTFQKAILVQNVPISNHDHGANGIIFDQNGDLLISIGGATNGGVPGTCRIGQIPDTYFQGAIVRIPISKSTATRTLQYLNPDGTLNMDPWQSLGTHMGPTDLDIYSPGHRNAYDCVFTKPGYIYCSDNGANNGFGPMSTGPTTDGGLPSPTQGDELNKVYPYSVTKTIYGMANRARAIIDNDPAQNIFYGPLVPSQGTYKAPVAQLQSAQGGVSVYNSRCFNGALEGAILAQRYKGATIAYTMSADGETVVKQLNVAATATSNGLDVYHSRGGAILISSHLGNNLSAYVPYDAAAAVNGNFVVYDVFPWRTPAAGGNSFVISGDNFGVSAKVYFGGVAATVTSVTQKRIYGVFPAGKASPTLLDMEVDMWFPGNTAQKIVYPKAMRYIPLPGNEPTAVY